MGCLQDRSEWHHSLLPGHEFQPFFFSAPVALWPDEKSRRPLGLCGYPGPKQKRGPLTTAPLAAVGLALMWLEGLLSKSGQGRARRSVVLVQGHRQTGVQHKLLPGLLNMDGMMG